MKKYLALALALLLCLGSFAGCGKQGTPGTTQAPQTNGQPQPEIKEDPTLHILVIGHSLGVDGSFLLPAVLQNEGVTDFELGVLYHSGCATSQHAQYLTNNEKQYAYYEFTSGQDQTWRRADCNGGFHQYVPGMPNDTAIEDGSIAVTMEYAITQRDWDIVVLQASTSEAPGVVLTGRNALDVKNIQKIIDYVLEKDINKATKPEFAWNMVWSLPNDSSLLNDARREYLNTYFKDEMEMYEKATAVAKDIILPAYDYDYLLPCGTSMQNAKSSALTGRALYRDTIHATDYGRLIASYTWYCGLTGKDIKECKFGPVYSGLLLDTVARNTGKDFVMTEQQKNILIESVGNAIAKPFELTLSQYK